MKRTSLILAAAFAFATFTANAADSLTMADFNHKIKLQVNGYTGSETLVNFPVLVRISESGIPGFYFADMSAWNNAHTQTYGHDLAFFTEDGTRLACEKDTWVHNGESLVWVKLPTMTRDTKFYMCYNVADGVYVTNDNPWVEYVGVWHLKETGGAGKTVYDSTTNALDGVTGAGATVSAGVIGAARTISTRYAKTTEHIHVSLADSAKRAVVDALVPQFTVSFWYRLTANNANKIEWEYFIGRRPTDKDANGGWALQFDDVKPNVQTGVPGQGFRIWSSETSNGFQQGSTRPSFSDFFGTTSTWIKLDVVYYMDDGTPKYMFYHDGEFLSGGNLRGTPLNGTGGLGIGGSAATASGQIRPLYGDMDEVRLRCGVRSADWIKADYDTVNNPDFVVSHMLTVEWADGAAPGLTGTTFDSASFAGTVQKLGDADSCAIQAKYWQMGGDEPEDWTTLTNGLVALGAFEVAVTGLSASTNYNYKLRAVGSDGIATKSVSGTFTTASGLTVEWSSVSSTPGFQTIAYNFAKVGGAVVALGGAESCAAQGKFWRMGAAEPADWTTLRDGLVRGDDFQSVVTGLVAGTAYNYKLRALGSDDSDTEPLAGTFITLGTPGEAIGSPDTHFFSDGTNAYWVANDFERYLPFTVTGYTGTETLTNFPVLVDVRKKDTNGFTYDDFYRFNGEDIAFVDDKGRVIPHEIDTWNPNGMTLIWVRLPEMVNGTEFTMCYRSPLLNLPADPGNTFEKYLGVWHMNERQDGVVDVIDSTTNNLIGETHAKSLAESNGRIGYARRVAQESGASSSAGRIIVFDHDNILRDVGSVFTYSGWYKLAKGTTDPDWAYLVSRKSEDDSKGWGIQYHDRVFSSTQMRVWAADEGKNKSGLFGIGDVGYKHDEWAYWTFVYSNQTFHAYFKGEELASTVTNFTLKLPVVNDENASYQNLVIGGMENGKGAMNGYVDEARYSRGVRSADWIKAEYDSMLQVNTPFVTKGGQVGRGVESLVPVVVWETGAGLPQTVIDVSYAYVQFAGTVTFCGMGADACCIEYQLWADGEVPPGRDDWTILLDDATAGTKFTIPVFGLKQDMPYNFRIRAANVVDGRVQTTREYTGSFRTHGNVNETGDDGELLRVDNKFVHRYPAGEYTFTTPDYVTNVEIIVVGGGGAGGYKVGGGGGGGGVFYSQSYAVTTSTTYRITVGRGGSAATNASTASTEGSGEYSTFALESDAAHPLISVPGGGGGGNYSAVGGAGADGASGGGGTYAKGGGSPVEGGVYGHDGGAGNVRTAHGDDKSAAGGGGGGGRAGLVATSDNWFFGGAGGVGVVCSMTGETLYFGAGGGGGYQYYTDGVHFSGPGGGGSGIGGDAADVRNGIPATSGVENTGAGGGGGSMTMNQATVTNQVEEQSYWQGGDGGDGVVIISYEVHGRDPISEEPRISMTGCSYEEEEGAANISYRVYWAGIQNDKADVYVHYSVVSSNELESAESGGWVKVADAAVGVGSATFVPPEVGYTYWVRLVARKDANSFKNSDEIASFKVPAIELNGATWTEDQTSPAEDHATVSYRLYDTNEVTHLYCYWSESAAALEGDEPPSGDDVYLLDLGPNTETNLSSSTSFRLPAAEGLVRNRTYYIRLACGDALGLKRFLSDEIVELDTAENPVTVLEGASWADSNVATVNFTATVGKLDPGQTELVVFYSLVEKDVKDKKPEAKETVTAFSLGLCSELALDGASSSAMFPLWSETVTNYYVRLALSTNVVVEMDGVATTNRVIVKDSYSQTRAISVSHAIEANTLLYIVAANPKVMCYGDAPQAVDYLLEFAGQTSGWGWENRYGLTGAMACGVTSGSSPGNYPIAQGTLLLEDGGATKDHYDNETGISSSYQYKLSFSGATYTITNAVFSTAIADVATNYTGDACDTSGLAKTLSGIRNAQPVTYLYRVGGAGEWGELPELTGVGNYNVQFKATAPNHDDVRGSFMLTINPAELSATVGASDLNYTGAPQTPAVVTNVAGLVRPDLNALTCEFRDESGEWQREVPTFTAPGTYKLYFRASAPNHKTFTTNCTFTIAGWDYMVNMDRASGYETPISVGDPGWLLKCIGWTGEQFAVRADRYAKLDETCANGLKLWHNYVIGRTNLTKRLVAAILQRGSRVNENAFVMYFPNVDPLPNTGMRASYRVDTKLRGEGAFTLGELSDKYEMNVPLGPHDPTGLYVFNIVLAPTNESYTGEAVLSSAATVGVLRVSSSMTNTVTVAPWLSASVDSTNKIEVAVANVVNPFCIGGGDTIHAYVTSNGTFRVWERKGDGGWTNLVTVTKDGVSECPPAEVATLEQGKAFWLVRNTPEPYIYLVGRYTGEDYETEIEGGTVAAPSYTLCANPTMDDVDLNELVFVDGEGNAATPAAGDRITVLDMAGMKTIYFRNAANTTWGCNVRKKVKGLMKTVWTEGGTIPSGTGFWYMRTGEGTLKIRFESVK